MQTYFVFGGNRNLYPYLFNNFSFLYFLEAPVLYFFIRGLVKDKFYLNKKDFIHLLPAAIRLLSNIPYYLTPFSYKQIMADKVLNDMESYKTIDLLNWYPNSWNNIFVAIQLFIYVIAALALLYKTRKAFASITNASQSQFHYVSTWIRILLMLILFLSTIHLITGFSYTLTDKSDYTTEWVSVLLYLAIYLYFALPVFVILNPRILYGYKDFRPGDISFPIDRFFNDRFESKKSNTDFSKDALLVDNTVEINISKKDVLLKGVESGNFHDKDMELLTKEILKFIEESKIFLNKDFHVKDICVALKVPQHHVQFCMNKILGKKFSDLKNEYRIQYAMELFLSRAEELSVEGVGHLSGFASNSNFYSTFKQFTGLTPNQWLKLNVG